jgi:hypothetical protein
VPQSNSTASKQSKKRLPRIPAIPAVGSGSAVAANLQWTMNYSMRQKQKHLRQTKKNVKRGLYKPFNDSHTGHFHVAEEHQLPAVNGACHAPNN